MSSVGRINIELLGIGQAIYNKMLAVPFYQRSYAWEDKHILDLFSDTINAVDTGESEYFLGTIVTTKNDTSRPEVSDGQQRLATVTILLSAIRDYFFNSATEENKRRANNITSQYLYSEDLSTLDTIPKLRLNDADNEFFLKRVLSTPDSSDRAIGPSKESHRKIVRACALAKEFVAGLAQLSKPEERLSSLVKYIHDSLKVIWVSVPDDANAFVIFETLNDRGLALAISDLLKNYLFGISGDRITEVQHRWIQMISTLEAIDNEEIIVTYIRHFWSSKYGSTREKELYNQIKKNVRNKAHALEFSTTLAENSKLYSAMLNTSHELWQKYGPTAREHMNTINLLRMIQIRPLILAVLSKFSVPEAQKALRLMVSWVVRFLIVGGLGGGTLEAHYSLSAREIYNGSIKTAKQLSDQLKKIIPTDAKFQDSFSTATVSTQYLARYYLRVLEKQQRGDAHPEFIPTDNTDIVNLEHVLPQNPSNLWNHISDEDKALYCKRIGNLALLTTPINTEAGNDSFAFKKQFYNQSEYLITKNLTAYKSWDKDSVAKRQGELASLAVKAWPLK
jgi:hypothetical protein